MMKSLEKLSALASSPRLLSFTFWGMVIATALTALYVHRAAALTLPTPSGDEALFVWQAHAFEVSNSFVAPELDPKNPILLLPLTYSGVLGVVFKFFGCTIDVARSFSLALVLAGFVILARLVRTMTAPRIALLLLAAVVLNARYVVMANAVRMEPLLLIVLGVSLVLMQRGKIWLALAVLASGPMIHPNGVLYLGAAIIYAIVAHGIHRKRPERSAVIFLGVAAILWLAHGIYVLRYWDAFMHDCAHRMGQMAASGKVGMSQLGRWPLLGLGLMGVTALLGVWRRVPIGYLLVFAVGAWLHSHLRLEEPYEPFRDLSYLLVSLALIEIGMSFVPGEKSTMAWLRPLTAGAFGVFFIAAFYFCGRIDSPKGYLHDITVSGMRVDPSGQYFTDEDRRALQALLKSTEPGREIVVEVYPWSDALLMADLRDTRVHYQVPYFDVLFRPINEWVGGYGPAKEVIPDLYIVRASRFIAPHLQYRTEAMISRALKHPGVEKATVVHTRDGSEIWYALRATQKTN